MKEYVKIGNICNIKTGKLDANASSNDGEYPFFTCSKTPLKINSYSYDEECVLIAGNGDLNVKYYNGKFDAYQRTYIITLKQQVKGIVVPYIYLFFQKYVEHLRTVSIGGVIKYIKLNNLTDAKIPVPPLSIQQQIVSELDLLSGIIEKQKKQLLELDNLAQSIFYQMFGNPVENEKGWEVKKLEEVCAKITDGKHGGCTIVPKSDYYFVGAREIVNDNVNYNTAQYITEEDFLKDYSRCNIEIGDFLIVNTGATIGKSAIAKDERTTKTLLQKSVALIKVNRSFLLPIYLQYCYKVNQEMYRVSGASAQPNLLLSRIKSTDINIPPLSLQKEFEQKIESIEHQKSLIKSSLHETETLFNSRMDYYFN